MDDLNDNGETAREVLQNGIAYMEKQSLQMMQNYMQGGECTGADIYDLWFGIANLNATLKQVVKVLDSTTVKPH